jgi:hypothetical protein
MRGIADRSDWKRYLTPVELAEFDDLQRRRHEARVIAAQIAQRIKVYVARGCLRRKRGVVL